MKMASEKVDRMGATLSTMRDLYQDLRSNAQSLNAFDLKDAVTRLETKLSAAISELSELRLLRDEAQSAKVNFMVTKVDLQAKKALIERQKIDLRKRGKLVHELMIAKGELQAELETRDATANEEKATHGEEGEVTDVQPPDDVEEYAQNAAAAILDQSVLCVAAGAARPPDRAHAPARDRAAQARTASATASCCPRSSPRPCRPSARTRGRSAACARSCSPR